jgi:hypothetical protein
VGTGGGGRDDTFAALRPSPVHGRGTPQVAAGGETRLGILELANRAVTLPGFLAHPDTFSYPTIRRAVPGAWVPAVMRGDPAVGDAYAREAMVLEAEGVVAIICNCGFNILYQRQVSAAVSVPVGSSSLLLLPFLAQQTPPGRPIGVLTFDAENLTEKHYQAAGWNEGWPELVTVGIEGSETHAALSEPEPEPTLEMLERDVLEAVQRLLDQRPDTGAILFECSAFCGLKRRVQIQTGLPVMDFVTMADLVMASVGAFPAFQKSESG